MVDYGAWLIEDLRDYVEDLLVMRSRAELYSERADYNNQILEIRAEILKREKNEC